MKFFILFLWLIVSGQSMATDLIFKSGFEATALVSGTASGINNSGLILKLTTQSQSETLNLNNNGVFVFATEVSIGDNWAVEINSFPSTPQQQNCITNNSSGNMPAGGVDTLQVMCNNNPWNWDQMNWDEGGWN
ncbi:MAG: hypothetical protein DWP95_08450 [Proteobacteria bacterium]|nr:MAG: hypothetical protein DWP95_08450 [Pseudomonadota bacterium]